MRQDGRRADELRTLRLVPDFTRNPLGSILCEMGAISADDLFTYVKEQVTEIICSLFEWRGGRFEVLARACSDCRRIGRRR